MAAPTTLSWYKLVVKLGDGQESEAFTAPCGLYNVTVNRTLNVSEVYPVDCATPETPVEAVRHGIGKTRTVTGEGHLDMDDLQTWREWFESGVEKNIQLEHADTAANGGGYEQGPFLLIAFNETAARDGSVVVINVEMQSAGTVAWTDAT